MDTTSHQGAPSPARREYRSVPGISDSRRLPRIGRLRLGVKKVAKNGKNYPVELDYFVIDTPAADSSAVDRAVHKRFIEAYGEKPKALDVIIPVEEREIFFPQAFKAYGAASLKCIGDGGTARRLGVDGHFHDVAEGCPGPDLCPFAMSIGLGGKPGCKFTASLFVLLPKVSIAGYFQIVTGSKHSAISINSSIETIQQMFGRVSGLAYIDPETGEAQTALRIIRRPAKMRYAGKTAIHYPVALEARITLQELLRLKTTGGLAVPALSHVLPVKTVPTEADEARHLRPPERLTAPEHLVDEIEPSATDAVNRAVTASPSSEPNANDLARFFVQDPPPADDVTDIISALDRMNVPQSKRGAILRQDHARIREHLRQQGVLR